MTELQIMKMLLDTDANKKPILRKAPVRMIYVIEKVFFKVLDGGTGACGLWFRRLEDDQNIGFIPFLTGTNLPDLVCVFADADILYDIGGLETKFISLARDRNVASVRVLVTIFYRLKKISTMQALWHSLRGR